jgi:preprotein translocase subunit SecY
LHIDEKVLNELKTKLKPTKTFWGIGSVILLFIAPEIVAFIWGDEIKSFVELQLQNPMPLQEEYTYKLIGELFGEVSWLNLIVGVAILLWAFF